MNLSSLILDALCVGLIVMMAAAYKKKGFLAGLVQLAGNIASLILANIVSQTMGPQLFDNHLRAGLEQQVQTAIGSGRVDLNELLDSVSQWVPQTIPDKINSMLDSAVAQGAEAVVTNVLRPILIPALTLIVFVVVYVVCRVLISMLARVLQLANKLPLVGGANQTLGILVGVAVALVDLFLIMCALYAASLAVKGEGFINMLDGSLAFGLFNRINPFLIR